MGRIRITDNKTDEQVVVNWDNPEPPTVEQAQDLITQQLEKRVQTKQRIKEDWERLSLPSRILAATPTPVQNAANWVAEKISPLPAQLIQNVPSAVSQAVRGLQNIGRPSRELLQERSAGLPLSAALKKVAGEQAGALADIGEGALGAIAPVALPLGLAVAPVPTLAGAGSFMATQPLIQKGEEAIGISPESGIGRLGALVAGSAVSGGLARAASKISPVKPPVIAPSPQASQIAPTSVPAAQVSPAVVAPTKATVPSPNLQANIRGIWATSKQAGLTTEILHKHILDTYGKESTKLLTKGESTQLIKDIKAGKLQAPVVVTPEVSAPAPSAAKQPLATGVTPPAPETTRMTAKKALEILNKGKVVKESPLPSQEVVKPIKSPKMRLTAKIPPKPKTRPTALPEELRGAKPSYNYGLKRFKLNFQSDVDKAAYITAQKTLSKRDPDYLKFAMRATGLTEKEVRAYGNDVRSRIKAQAKESEPGTIVVNKGERGALVFGAPKPYIKERLKSLGNITAQPLSMRTRVQREGVAGKNLMNLIDQAFDTGEVYAGQRLVKLRDSELHKVTDKDVLDIVGELQGKQPKNISAEAVKNAQVVKDSFSSIGDEMELLGGEVSLKQGSRVPFAKRENYYPKVAQTPEQLEVPKQRELTIQNMMRNEDFASHEKAESFINDYTNFIKNGGRYESLIKYVMQKAAKHGQKLTEADAFAKLQQFRSKGIKRQGSLEYAREIDLPVYDPDVRVVAPKYIHSATMRLSEIGHFGQDNQVINKYINKIRKAGNDADFARMATDRMLKFAGEGDTSAAKAYRLVRTMEGFKLSPTSTIKNALQGTWNSALKGDIPSALYGFKQLWTKQGRRFGVESGAAIDSLISESLRHSGASGRALTNYLRGIGFAGAERANRVVAANAGLRYSTKLLNKAKKGSTSAKSRLAELLGRDASEAIQRGTLTEHEQLLAAKRFSDLTQFRSRPQDWPVLASTDLGRVVFQFKSYIYGQSKLIYDSTVKELKAGNFGRATRNLAVLGTVFPLGGELTRQIVNIITGKKDQSEGLRRYFEDVLQVGGAGVVGDALQAGEVGKGTEFIVGPAASDIGEALTIAGRKGQGLTRQAVRRVPGLGPMIYHRVFPKKQKASHYAPRLRPLGRRLAPNLTR